VGKPRAKVEEEVSANLIPMIDIMFLLLLFFMLGADMGQRELEEVTLPTASVVKPPAEDAVLTVNVYHPAELTCAARAAGDVCHDESHWRVGIRGVDFDPHALLLRLRDEADLEREPQAPRPSARRIIIRADQAALYGLVQQVLAACSDERVRIYKVEVAAAQPAEG
jgi:biopolymer transport protein ExbD